MNIESDVPRSPKCPCVVAPPPGFACVVVRCCALVGILVVRELRAHADRCEPTIAAALRGARFTVHRASLACAAHRGLPREWAGVELTCASTAAARAADVIRARADRSGLALRAAMRCAYVEESGAT